MLDKSVAAELTRKLADGGMILEAGWQAIAHRVKNEPPAVKHAAKMAYYIGAQHLFASVLSFLDPSGPDEVTADDMQRMSKLHAELEKIEPEIKGWITAAS